MWVRQRVECVWSLLGDMFIRSACRLTAIVSTYVSERWSTMAICLVLSHSPTPHFLHLCMREIVNEISSLSFDLFYYFPHFLHFCMREIVNEISPLSFDFYYFPHFLHFCMREIVNEISPLSFELFYYFPYSLLRAINSLMVNYKSSTYARKVTDLALTLLPSIQPGSEFSD